MFNFFNFERKKSGRRKKLEKDFYRDFWIKCSVLTFFFDQQREIRKFLAV